MIPWGIVDTRVEFLREFLRLLSMIFAVFGNDFRAIRT